MSDFATVTDLTARWRALSADEQTQATILLADVSAALRVLAIDRGRDLDAMIVATPALGTVTTAIVCDIVRREMCGNSDAPAMSQLSQSVNGYSMQGTFLSPGGGLFIKNNELKMLGLMKQRIKAVTIYDESND